MQMPGKLFISYAHENAEFVVQLATALHASGQEVFWDRWELSAGDSLIERLLEEGLKEAAWVAAVVSRASIESRWVREELSIATVRRLDGKVRVIPIVIEDVEVPLALSALVRVDMRKGFDLGVRDILNAINGVRERPAVAEVPAYIKGLSSSVGGLSPIATTVGVAMVQRIDVNSARDPEFNGHVLCEALACTPIELNDAVDELLERGLVTTNVSMGMAPFGFVRVEPTYRLYHHFRERLAYDPADDIRAVVSCVASLEETNAERVAHETLLPAGRFNRAVEYIHDHSVAEVIQFMGSYPYVFAFIRATRKTRQIAAEQ
jgi:TIR domain